MLLIDSINDPVAEWAFQYWPPDALINSKTYFNLVDQILIPIQRNNFFSPTQLHISNWIPPGPGNDSMFKTQLALPWPVDTTSALFIQNHRAPQAVNMVPESLLVEGKTRTFFPGKRYQEIEGVLEMQIDFTGGLDIWIRTFSDCWLEYDLKGREQSEMHQLNAPHLEHMLASISILDNLDFQDWHESRYSKRNGFCLENHWEEDGTPMSFSNFSGEVQRF